MKHFSDSECMERVQKGHADCFTELYRRHHQKLIRYLLKNTGGDHATADEISQVVWGRVFKYARNYESRDTFIAWLFTIARNSLFTELKNSKKFPLLKTVEVESDSTQWIDTQNYRSGNTENDVDSPTNPEMTYFRKAEVNLVQQALNLLPNGQAKLIQQVLLENLSYAEIAAAENATVTSIKTRIFRARKSFLRAYQSVQPEAKAA